MILPCERINEVRLRCYTLFLQHLHGLSVREALIGVRARHYIITRMETENTFTISMNIAHIYNKCTIYANNYKIALFVPTASATTIVSTSDCLSLVLVLGSVPEDCVLFLSRAAGSSQSNMLLLAAFTGENVPACI